MNNIYFLTIPSMTIFAHALSNFDQHMQMDLLLLFYCISMGTISYDAIATES